MNVYNRLIIPVSEIISEYESMISLKLNIVFVGYPVLSFSLSFSKSNARLIEDVSRIRQLIRWERWSDLISRSLYLDGISTFDAMIPSTPKNISQFKSHFILEWYHILDNGYMFRGVTMLNGHKLFIKWSIFKLWFVLRQQRNWSSKSLDT